MPNMPKVRVNWGRLDADQEVKLYVIYNTVHRSLYVLAPDRAAALEIDHTANHIHSPTWSFLRKDKCYPYAEEIKGAIHGQISDNWSSIEQAIEQRAVGTLHFVDGQFLIGDEVFEK
jgi:hypothetical protein